MQTRSGPPREIRPTERGPIGYIAPVVIFGLFTAAEPYLPSSLYPLAYVVKMAAVTLSYAVWRRPLRDIRPSRGVIIPSVLLGLAVFVAWVTIDTAVAYPHLGSRVGFDPFGLRTPFATAAFLAVRFYGLVVLVPVMEELFWRSFLLRYFTAADFTSLPIGTFSLSALLAMVALSALAHPEWIVAAIASAGYGLWLRHTRTLFATVVAHAVTNGALGIYILATHDWKYW